MSSPTSRSGLLSTYDSGEYYCELLGSSASPHPVFETIEQQLSTITEEELRSRAVAAENDLFDLGVTFTVYSEKNAIDRVLPFDMIPRVVSAERWKKLESGLLQRISALNQFLYDVYHDRRILKEGIIPEELVQIGRAHV